VADELTNTEPSHDDANGQFLALMWRYLDGELSQREMAELNDLLRNSSEHRRQFAEFCTRACLIRETYAPQREALLREEPGEGRQVSSPPRPRQQGRRRLRVLVAVSILLAGVALWLCWPSARRADVPSLGTLEQVAGDVSVVTATGESRSVSSTTSIQPGDTVRTRGPQGSAALIYADGTRLTLVGDTSLTCKDRGGKSVVVHHGTLAASVQPQPESNPMVLETPAAQVRVLGTEFLVEISANQTDLSVTEGRVRLIRVKDGKEIDVPKGKRVKAGERTALTVEDILRPPDIWGLDFKDGLPTDFRRGRFTNETLPPGSKGAVTAVRTDLGKYGVWFQIATPNLWNHGLFTPHDDSHFHFTYKMDRPNWVNVFLIARGQGAHGAYSVNYLFNELEYRRRHAGQWRTVSIPLARFGKAGGAPGRLSANEVPYTALFSTESDTGLVIDRLWVTRGGPGVVKYADIP